VIFRPLPPRDSGLNHLLSEAAVTTAESGERTRPNVCEVDLSAIASNTSVVRELLGPGVQFYAALKANAYGFGLMEVAGTVLGAGADALAMAELADASRLRDAGITSPILLYPGGFATAETADLMRRQNIFPTVLDLQSAQTYSGSVSAEMPVFVKVDVGLERLGVPAEKAVKFVQSVVELPNLTVRGIYTHMHLVDGARAEEYAAWQFRRFVHVIDELDRLGLPIPVRMASSSASVRMTSAMNLNAADPGHLIYGLVRAGPGRRLDLRPALLSLRTKLIQVRELTRVEWFEEAPFDSEGVTRLGVIPMGRADGMTALNGGHVLVRGTRVPILAKPSLEHTRLDLSRVDDAKSGDEVVIIGRQGREEITTREVASFQAMPEAGVALEVRPSVTRVYVGGR
jgi:alanine racemase